MKLSFLALSVFIILASCKKGDDGPAGPAGAAGPAGVAGPQGIAGNANVMQYTYGIQALNISFVTLGVTTTLDTMNKSAWFVYLYYQPIDRWYFVPGLGTGGITTYRVSLGYAAGKANIYIDKSGVGESYNNAKVVRVYTSGQTAGGRASGTDPVTNGLPEIDFSDYNAVKSYYHLPD